MSEYDYYEFLALDQPLSNLQKAELRKISSRAHISSSNFSVVYNYKSLSADATDLMERYFDAHLYMGLYACTEFYLRVPLEVFSERFLEKFGELSSFEVLMTDNSWILKWNQVEPTERELTEPLESQGWMSRLVPIREELLNNDFRSLYLAWLANDTEIDDSEHEPFVPEGLGDWTLAQLALAELLEIDVDLLAAVGIGLSKQDNEPDDQAVRQWLSQLPNAEVTPLLFELLKGNGAHAARTLKKHYQSWQKKEQAPRMKARKFSEILKNIDVAKAQRLAHEKAEAERIRAEKQHVREVKLKQLALDFPKVWRLAADEASRGCASAYEEACKYIVDLKDAYQLIKDPLGFKKHLASFLAEHGNRPALNRRLEAAGIIKQP